MCTFSTPIVLFLLSSKMSWTNEVVVGRMWVLNSQHTEGCVRKYVDEGIMTGLIELSDRVEFWRSFYLKNYEFEAWGKTGGVLSIIMGCCFCSGKLTISSQCRCCSIFYVKSESYSGGRKRWAKQADRCDKKSSDTGPLLLLNSNNRGKILPMVFTRYYCWSQTSLYDDCVLRRA